MADQEIWYRVDSWFNDLLHQPDDGLRAALDDARKAGLPTINVAPNQGKFIHLLAQIHGARRILEIGTLGGYSAIWLARALPDDGALVTIEVNPEFAAVARANIERAGLKNRVSVLVGDAAEVLDRIASSKPELFDMVFIDADKPSNPVYLEKSLALTRPGGIILIDNVVRRGEVADPSDDPGVAGSRAVTELIGANPRLSATHLQTVGSKGYDGLLLVRVND